MSSPALQVACLPGISLVPAPPLPRPASRSPQCRHPLELCRLLARLTRPSLGAPDSSEGPRRCLCIECSRGEVCSSAALGSWWQPQAWRWDVRRAGVGRCPGGCFVSQQRPQPSLLSRWLWHLPVPLLPRVTEARWPKSPPGRTVRGPRPSSSAVPQPAGPDCRACGCGLSHLKRKAPPPPDPRAQANSHRSSNCTCRRLHGRA